MTRRIVIVTAILCATFGRQTWLGVEAQIKPFEIVDATIEDIHTEFKAGRLTSRALVQAYLDRIEAYDKNGPKINSVITVNPKALEEADAMDAAYKKSGPVGLLHGIPVVLKDQMDVAGLPTTLGSVVMKDNVPVKDSFVTEKVKKAGGIILAKVTLGEMGGGDSYGSLYGVSRNPYDPERTVGGSSGGTGAAVSANFATIGIGQEGFASIRRPSIWNSIVGMRPTPGLVSRSGVWAGWPSRRGSLGPMTRTVTDMAKLLDVMVGYDPEDPVTALGVGKAPDSYTKSLDRNGLKGARIGILRTPMGYDTSPDSEDFKAVTTLFDKAVADLKAAGATVIDPIEIPRLNELLARRGAGDGEGVGDGAAIYFARNPGSTFKTMADVRNSPDFSKVVRRRPATVRSEPGPGLSESVARDELMIEVMKVMADHKLDSIVHKAVEHTPTLIKDGINPPYTNQKGAPHLNTFLIYAASMVVPAGFTSTGLPVGITFFGRPYSEPTLIRQAYAYEQATKHRVPPKTTPSLGVKRTN
ncbi:MAG TPA: amidase family protein [Vicinamibacterales bacterium]|nr:amidase family protein [Vicinamibacterales bacterium]